MVVPSMGFGAFNQRRICERWWYLVRSGWWVCEWDGFSVYREKKGWRASGKTGNKTPFCKTMGEAIQMISDEIPI